jgi:hypothetical protein
MSKRVDFFKVKEQPCCQEKITFFKFKKVNLVAKSPQKLNQKQ